MISVNLKNKKNFKYPPSNIVAFRYSTIALIITFIFSFIVPQILNYGPGSINTDFNLQVAHMSYSGQFSLAGILIVLLITISTKISLRDIDKWWLDESPEKFRDIKRILKVRKQCINLPYLFLALEIILPVLLAVIALLILRRHTFLMIIKIIILLLSFSTILAITSFIFTRDLNETIISLTYVEGFDIGIKVSLKQRMLLIIFPLFIASLLIVALTGYSSSIIEKENLIFNIYHTYLNMIFDKNKIYSPEELYSTLSELQLVNETDVSFILYEDNTIDFVHGDTLSDFAIAYTRQLSDLYDGRIYGNYGSDRQGSSIKLMSEKGPCYVGMFYQVYSETSLVFLSTAVISLLIITFIILYIFSNSLSKNLRKISEGFKKIYDNSNTSTILPVTSNDEIGELVLAFNEIQKLNNKHVKTITNNQNMLVERERLASLGQMIGGIAHNLKTPIFSISGGIEGLSSLIKEFDESIEDPNVNNQDMHEIAKDMNVWIGKMKTHLSYMSEVITTVKGQAVNLSGDDSVNFTIDELFSHTSILMRHELQRALIDLEIENNVPNDVILTKNMNSLVQVLNNLISNAIQAYKGTPNKKIELKANLKDNKIVILVKDYGPGIPSSIKDKLFKEMVTTKGKEGTGLGLFMSHSMIKAKFNGNIKFETSPRGTEFYIILPI